MPFEPIAIIGQACVLPGALTPEDLWRAVLEGRDLVSSAPEGHWRVDPGLVLATDPQQADDHTWTDRGGYVQGFASVFDPQGFAIPADQILTLDPLFHWVLHGGREALRSAGCLDRSGLHRAGAILGNLSYPSTALSRLAESVWLDEVLGRRFLDGRARELAGIARPDPVNRFMSGLPAHLLCRALGLGAGGFCLDSACSSSLYAIKLACDSLHDRRTDLMLAGGVNRADDLFIHIGFCALQAMSRSGQSRPFCRHADGLLPAEGAAFVALRRLDDALAAGDPILGVIRGIGLSNDGRGRGLLAPCAAGQARALRQAYAQSGLDPSQVAYVECHATGTPVGDVVEVESTSRVFSGVRELVVGTLKANLGHLITASGAAGLLKVLAALRAGVFPPSIHAEAPLEELARSPLRMVTEQEAWHGPRRAAVSNFGFGGNNAHLIVESVSAEARRAGRRMPPAAPDADVAVVALQVLAGDGRHRADFVRDLFAGATRLRRAEGLGLEGGLAGEVELPALGLRFPPKDLDETLAQQLMVLKAALLAVEETGPLPGEGTGVFIGMQCDAEVARYGARLRMPEWARRWGAALGISLDEGWLAEARAGVGFLRKAAGVVGAMPNIPANRLNSQLDLGGASFTVSAEELSGVVCFELAARALRRRELDAALVGAVDLCCEPVHVAAARQVLTARFPGEGRDVPGDAAVVLVLKRLEDAQRDGDRVYAVLPAVQPDGEPTLRLGPAQDGERLSLLPQFGHSHAACGLLHLAAAALACDHRASPAGPGRPAVPWWPAEGRRAARVEVTALGGVSREVTLVEPAGEASPLLLEPVPRLHLYAGRDRAEVRQRLQRDEQTERGDGSARLVLVAAGEDQLDERRRRALELLATAGGDFRDDGVCFHERPLPGELALVFTGPAGVYPGMGRELVLGLPALLQRLQARCRHVERTASWIYDAAATEGDLGPHEKLWGSSFLGQLHAELTLGLLGLQPRAAIGFCSGESNALFALGAWSDLDAFYNELLAAGVFSREISGELNTVRRAWSLGEGEAAAWQNWRILVPEEEVSRALAGEPRCHLTIFSAPGDVVIGGEPEACRRVVARVGRLRAYPLGYDVAMHCPELESFADRWRELHHRRTSPVPGVRFYTSASCSSYEATADAAADALLGMALRRVDFPAVVRRAYDDGVRIFVEHGPRDGCTKWIDRILGEREHLAVALDRGGRSSIEQAMHAVAELVAAGVPVELEALQATDDVDRMTGSSSSGPTRSYPAHPAPLALPPLPPRRAAAEEAQRMEPAPPLPSVLEQVERPSGARSPTSVPASTEGRLAAGQARLAEAHRAFLIQQAQVHESFLGFRQRSLARLAELCRQPTGVAATLEPAVVAPPVAAPATGPGGPGFSREQLQIHASGRISELFGPLFAQQDRHARQVRLPEPPLLLVDRVVGLEGEAGSMGSGTVWTETDVGWDSWYLHDGFVPAGIVVEAGQADLLLISWLGIDFHNQGKRVYRLLGCELTNRGTLPRPGDTLRYAIRVDGHARAGEVRLFFFHYDCYVGDELRLQVRNAQAGFFTDEELAQSGGVLWEPETQEVRPDAPCDPPAVVCTRRRFSAEQVRAYSEGRAYDCFGPGFERCLTHTRTPRIQPGRMLLLQEVTAFDPQGGPWGRGYLRVDNRVASDDWTMQGHFKNDPCMPGTLMCEGCLQAMAFYIAAMGCTVQRDGWRFEPVPDETYKLQCRGQVVPGSKHLTYEVFVEEFSGGPMPTIIADILGTCDGLKIFHGRRMGLRLVPDWPMTSMRPEELRRFGVNDGDDRPVAELEGFRFDQRSLLACAWGRPSEAFGQMARVFDGTRHIARLPGPPYHFMSRVTRIEGEMGSMRSGASIELEYDIPSDAWYLQENGAPVMPYCVLLEAVLQPCGWLAVYIGCPGSADVDLYFRNLDGTGTVHAELTPDSGTLSTRTTLTSISKVGHVILVSFDVACRVGEQPVYTLKTSFGFFPAEALADQVGLPASEEQRARLAEPSEFAVDLTARPARYFDGPARLPGPMLLMLDRVTGYWPEGGRAGLGRLRAEKDVNPAEWFFRAHFFQDPVQPGSLGLEAMFQLLGFYMIHTGMPEAAGVERPRLEPIALGRPFTWKYRGQVTPEKKRVTVEMELLERGTDHAVAEAWLWVDGLCIYHSADVALRIVSGDERSRPDAARSNRLSRGEAEAGEACRAAWTAGDEPTSGGGLAAPCGAHPVAGSSPSDPDEDLLDPEVDRWLRDHRPNWTLPTLPLMSMVDRLAAAAARRHPGLVVVAVHEVEIAGWLILDGPRRLRTRVAKTTPPGPDGALELEVTLEAWREAATPALSRFEAVARGRVILARNHPPPPEALPPLEDARSWPDPYAAGALFHGPAFQVLRRLEVGGNGSTAWLDAGGGSVPPGLLNQGLLDGAVHGILHDSLEHWLDVPAKQIAYPFRLRRATFHGPAPREGELRCEVRVSGFDGGERFPMFQIQLLVGERPWAELQLVEVLIPMGPHADDRQKRIDFREGRFVEGAGLSRFEGPLTRLTDAEVRSRDWLRGSVAFAYQASSTDPEAMTRELAVKDHLSQRARVHPATVRVSLEGDRIGGVAAAMPLTRYPVTVTREGEEVVVADAGQPQLDLAALRAFGRRVMGLGPWLGEDLSLGLCRRFLRGLHLDDPEASAQVAGRGALYLGNHQVQVESMLLPMAVTAATGVHVVTVAKEQHRTGWIGPLSSFTYRYPGVSYPRVIVYFDQSDPASMFGVLEELRRELTEQGHSVFVHVEGELARCCRRPVEKLSSVFLDLAQELGLPIVPVRLAGGLPVEALPTTADFPLGYAAQDYHLGRPIAPEELAELPYAGRRRCVLEALNRVGPPLAEEHPSPPDPAFAARVAAVRAERGLDEVRAVVLAILEELPDPSAQTARLLAAVGAGRLAVPDDPEGRWLADAATWLLGEALTVELRSR